MATASNIRRKNIDLPIETLQKLSVLAASQGKSLKKYIETILISKADSVNVEISENPSPSGDPWFGNPANISMVKKGMKDIAEGRCRECSMDEIREMLDI